MRNIFTVVLLLCMVFVANAQELDFIDKDKYDVKLNERYGDFDRNVFDIITPKDGASHALVLYIHGGGFYKGQKEYFYERKDDIKYLLEHNVAVATMNYRFFKKDDEKGVRLCLRDVQQFLQFIRFNADEYGIDKNHIASYGISAGAGSSLYFAYHDDLAISGDSTLLGESTKLQCCGAIDTQATYDVLGWVKFLPYMHLIYALKRSTFNKVAANFFGYPTWDEYKPYKKELAKELDMLSMIDANDPPTYLMNLLKENFPKNDYIIQHHLKHATVVAKKLNKNGVENYVYTKKNADTEADIDYPIAQFFVEHLK